MNEDPMVEVWIEPSAKLSEELGFAFLVKTEYPASKLLAEGLLTEDELAELKKGKVVPKTMKVTK